MSEADKQFGSLLADGFADLLDKLAAKDAEIERLEMERDDADAERNVANASLALIEEKLIESGARWEGEYTHEVFDRVWLEMVSRAEAAEAKLADDWTHLRALLREAVPLLHGYITESESADEERLAVALIRKIKEAIDG